MGIQRQARTAPHNEWGPLPPHTTPRARRRGARLLERLLFAFGIISLGYYGYVSVESALYQSFENRELDAILASAPSAPPPELLPQAPPRTRRVAPSAGSPMGRIVIPRLGVSAVIRAGSDARTLRLAVGYIPGTALPGDEGNTGLAAHRDTFFRRLRDIRAHDEIRVVTPDGTFAYMVQNTRIVQPTDTWVLNRTSDPTLTLVTCYPFTYIGSAPQRFIVRAALRNPLRASAE